jgi:hypothetical protein
MSRTTALPARTSRLLLAGAVGATTLVGVGAASADDANPWALTAAAPAYLSTVSPAKVTLTGKGFRTTSAVTFTDCAADRTQAVPATGASVDPKGTRLTVTPPVCVAGSKPRIRVVTDGIADSTRVLYNSKITYVAKPVLLAVAPVSPAKGPWTGGTPATATFQSAPVDKAVVQIRLGVGTAARSVPAKVSADDPRTFVFTTPPGVPGTAQASATVFGIASDEVAGFTYESTIKTTPASWVTSAPAPLVKVTGAGFGTDPSKVTVTVCGKAVDAGAVRSVTDRSVSFTAPTLTAPELPGGHGACTVAVEVAGGHRSLVTAGSTFTYAAYQVS